MKKIIMGLVLSLLVFGKVFAFDLKKITTCETEEMGTIDVYFDIDQREPFYIKTESIEYFLILKEFNEEVEVLLVKDEEMDEGWRFLLDLAIENNCYCIFMECENWYNIELHINIDNSVTAYVYRDTEE